MKQITAYKLTNGWIIENENEAKMKQKEIDFENSLTALVNNNVAYSDNKEAIISFISQNVFELKPMFDKFRI